ncbi:hypothetical protein TRICI_002318 [Trichomonascus ciferrii]|uniref:Uncharacterized protein n=1 Tax=Trichomonascus ciferrii TaxID=44093 RepID=A0A642V6V6_9ASCO|nr:hypothetical protein TRICI_002318 [Trichomonascus ciferrii]
MEECFFGAYRPPHIEETVAAEFTSLKQGKMTVMEYFNRFNTMRNRAIGIMALHELAALGMFKQGLCKEFSAQAKRAPGVRSVRELLPVLTGFEMDTVTEDSGNQHRQGTNRPNRFPNRYNSRANNFADPARANVPHHESQPTTDAYGDVAMHLMSLSSQERQRRLTERRCFACGSQGHFQRDCDRTFYGYEEDSKPDDPLSINLIDGESFCNEVIHHNAVVGVVHVTQTDGEPVAKPEDENLPKFIQEEFSDVVADELPHHLAQQREVKVEHAIDLEPGKRPPSRRAYRMSFAQQQELDRQIKELLERGFIRNSMSPYSAPVLFAKKKDGSMRLCIDYRALNEQTIKNKFPLPLMEDLLDMLHGAKFLSKIDLMSGYHQVPIKPSDCHKTAFSTRYGHYEWVVIPFGLCNAPATFQSAMNRVLQPFIGRFVVVYLDNILIFSSTAEEHEMHIRQVLNTLRANQFVAKRSKCEFFKTKLDYLGFTIENGTVRPDADKIEAVKNWPTPTTSDEYHSFTAFCGVYRRHIENYSRRADPLINYQNKKTPWGPEQDAAFADLKDCMSHYPGDCQSLVQVASLSRE